MVALREWWQRLVGTVRRAPRDADMEEELQLHVEMLADELHRRGLTPDAAAREARLRAGSVTHAMDARRDQRGLPWLTGAGRDVRYGVRLLTRTPASSLAAVLSLAAALAAATATFSVVHALYFKPLTVPSPGQLVAIATLNPGTPDEVSPLPLRLFEEIRRRSDSDVQVFAWRDAIARTLDAGDGPFFGGVNEVSADYFSALGATPLLGRLFRNDEVASLGTGASAPVAVLDYRCWVARFGRDPAVVGRTLVVDGTRLTIIGVLPETFVGLNVSGTPDAVVPIGFDVGQLRPGVRPGGSINFFVAARVVHGSVSEASARLEASWPDMLEATAPNGPSAAARSNYLARRLVLESLRTGTAGSGITVRTRMAEPLRRLLGLSLFVVVVAGLNLAILLLARSAARQRELALRVALGATTGALLRTTIVEGLLLSLAGTALGVLAAFWLAPFLFNLLTAYPGAPRPLSLAVTTGPDLAVVVTAAVAALVLGTAAALVPGARVIAGADAARVLPSARVIQSRGRLQPALISLQIALAVLLIGTALMFARSLSGLDRVDPGYRVDGLVRMRLQPQGRQQVIGDPAAYFQQVAETIGAVPGVEAVTFDQGGPLQAGPPQPVSSPGAGETDATLVLAGPEFFRTMGVTVNAGREFDWHDRESRERVAVVSRSLEHQLFAGASAIDRTLVTPAPFVEGPLRIVGVVSDANWGDLRTRRDRTVYVALMQTPELTNAANLELRTEGDALTVARSANRALMALGRHYAFVITTVASLKDYSLRDERLASLASVLLAGLTLVLAAWGVYGLLAYSVALRRSEIGVRMAMGAGRTDILRLVLRDAGRMLGTGLLMGVPLTVACGRWIAGQLYGVTASDPTLLALIVAVISGTVLVAAAGPAHRAARVDPIDALRRE